LPPPLVVMMTEVGVVYLADEVLVSTFTSADGFQA
jgi:hypothetical protein